ncbi:MAG TPA: chemotaxis protein CheW [Myxococcota bacterium]|nr:chemotaxis protein CheW [Myxococcota bacterium]
MNTEMQVAASAPVQVLSFVVGKEEYAIEILRVQEIKCYTSITPIPNAAPHIKGVMNLRGAVVPVVDLRVRFGLSAAACTPLTVIILVALKSKTVGFIVDAVSDVLQIAPEAVTPPPETGMAPEQAFLSAIARVDDRLFGLVDVDVVGNMA